MTEHSVEELERQYQAARSRVAQAQSEANEAQRRLRLGKLAATGLAGHVVSYVKGWGRNKAAEVRFVVRSVPDWPPKSVAGYIVRKDGTEGEREARAEINDLTDHGPYMEPSK